MSPQMQHVAFNKPTPVSNILKVLIKTCIIPLKINRSEKTTSVTFKLKSKQTFIFCLYLLIIFGTTFFMMFYMFGINHIMTRFLTKFHNSNTIDFMSLICIMMMGTSVPILCLPFSKQLTYVASEIFQSPNLQLPNHWKKFVLFSLFYVLSLEAFTCIHITNSTIDDDEDIEYSWWIAAIIIQITVNNIFVFIFFFVVLCCIDEFKRITYLPKNDIIFHTNKCIDYFKTLQKGFGTTFLITYSYYQIQNVFCTYMSISSLMSMNENFWQNIVLSVCYFTMSAYFMAILYCITLTSEEAYDTLQSLNTPLEKMMLNENNFTQREQIKATMRKLEKIQPLNGNGYFNITRETLTSIVSTTVTYLIILLQFR